MNVLIITYLTKIALFFWDLANLVKFENIRFWSIFCPHKEHEKSGLYDFQNLLSSKIRTHFLQKICFWLNEKWLLKTIEGYTDSYQPYIVNCRLRQCYIECNRRVLW